MLLFNFSALSPVGEKMIIVIKQNTKQFLSKEICFHVKKYDMLLLHLRRPINFLFGVYPLNNTLCASENPKYLHWPYLIKGLNADVLLK